MNEIKFKYRGVEVIQIQTQLPLEPFNGIQFKYTYVVNGRTMTQHELDLYLSSEMDE